MELRGGRPSRLSPVVLRLPRLALLLPSPSQLMMINVPKWASLFGVEHPGAQEKQ